MLSKQELDEYSVPNYYSNTQRTSKAALACIEAISALEALLNKTRKAEAFDECQEADKLLAAYHGRPEGQ